MHRRIAAMNDLLWSVVVLVAVYAISFPVAYLIVKPLWDAVPDIARTIEEWRHDR
jgi:hypothetical protein